MSTFTRFSNLPSELQTHIFSLARPSTPTIHITEATFDVPSVSPPPGLLTTSRAARAAALSWDLKPFPIYTTEYWQDIYLDPEAQALRLVIAPSKVKGLEITWTEIHAILGDALLAVKKLQIMCNQPERLVRLWMVPGEQIVSVGESCVEATVWGKEVVASDSEVRERLQKGLEIHVSDASGEAAIWRVGDVQLWSGWGEGCAEMTRGFERVGIEEEDGDAEACGQDDQDLCHREGESGDLLEEVKDSGAELTEALGMLCEEMARLYPKTVYKAPEQDLVSGVSS